MHSGFALKLYFRGIKAVFGISGLNVLELWKGLYILEVKSLALK